MLTVTQVFAYVPNEVTFRGGKTKLTQFAVGPKKDGDGTAYAHCLAMAVCPPPHGTGRVHKVELHVYHPNGAQAPVWLSCGCEDFMYRWEVALTIQHSSALNYSNGVIPMVKNPNFYPGCCKHLVAMIRSAMKRKKVSNYAKKK